MHAEAFQWVAFHAPQRDADVLEIGSYNVNGEVRHLFTGSYLGLDIKPGAGVDVVADAATYRPGRIFDVVVCCEVLEHTESWRDIVATCGGALRPGGVLILTCAGTGRAPHGADGGTVGDEYYDNISVADLEDETWKWGDGIVRRHGHDTQAYVVKRR